MGLLFFDMLCLLVRLIGVPAGTSRTIQLGSGTNGDNMTANELQQNIKEELSNLGWSLSDFVMEYGKSMKYKSGLKEEALKKQLSRKTTQPGLLQAYLNFIYGHEAWIKLGKIRPVCTSSEEFDAEFNNRMANISKMISTKLENDL